MELVPMVTLARVLMVTQALARMRFQGPKEAEASLLLYPELMALVIRQELVELRGLQELAEVPEWDVLAPAVVVELVELEQLEEAILAQPVVHLAALLVNLILAAVLHV